MAPVNFEVNGWFASDISSVISDEHGVRFLYKIKCKFSKKEKRMTTFISQF